MVHDDPLRQILSQQPFPAPTEEAWQRLQAQLEPRLPENRRPFRPSRRRHPLRWGMLAASLTLLIAGTVWVATGGDNVSSWSQVHAASLWGTGTADPSWVAMEVASP